MLDRGRAVGGPATPDAYGLCKNRGTERPFLVFVLRGSVGSKVVGTRNGLPARADAIWLGVTASRFFSTRGEAASLPSAIATRIAIPEGESLPAILFLSGRELLGLSQQDLHLAADVSKKMINDFENGFRIPGPRIQSRLRLALEGAGARFVRTDEGFGVIVELTRSDLEKRTLRRQERSAMSAADPHPASRPRGRPRKET